MCGYNYASRSATESAHVALPPTSHESRLSVGSGFRFGLGFMSAAVVFWILFSLIFFGALGAIFGSVFRSLPR